MHEFMLLGGSYLPLPAPPRRNVHQTVVFYARAEGPQWVDSGRSLSARN